VPSPKPPRKVLVTGASSAIGVEVCRRYLSTGLSVVAHYFEGEEALTSQFPSESRLELLRCDLADLSAVSQVAQAHVDSDIAVFLASLAAPSSLEHLDTSQLERAMAIGALSNYVLLGSIGPAMAARRWGRIAIGSSIGVKFGGGSDSFAYALANHASEFLPRSVRDWTSQNVLTNVVRIGVTDTQIHAAFPTRNLEQRVDLIPLKRAATTAEIADFITWYASGRNTYVSGQIVAISGGE